MKIVPCVAIVCIAALEAVALVKEVDGALFGVAVAAIAGLGGYELKILRDHLKGGK